MSLLATTPGDRLVIPSSSTAGCPTGVRWDRSGAAAVMATAPRPGPDGSPGKVVLRASDSAAWCPSSPPEPGTDTARDDATATSGPCRPAWGQSADLIHQG